jgi:hypothetical protein
MARLQGGQVEHQWFELVGRLDDDQAAGAAPAAEALRRGRDLVGQLGVPELPVARDQRQTSGVGEQSAGERGGRVTGPRRPGHHGVAAY